MKRDTMIFLFWLPLAVLLVIVGWTVFGALPGVRMTGDMITWLLELPVVTAYALAAVSAPALFKRVFWREIDAEEENRLHEAAAAGDKSARWIITKDRLEWLALLILSGIFFFPHY